MGNQKSSSNGIASFLTVLGYIILGLGSIGVIILSTVGYSFNWVIFLVGLLSTAVSGAIMLGLGEIVNKLHRIEVGTQSVKEINSRILDIRDYQQGIIEAIIENKKTYTEE